MGNENSTAKNMDKRSARRQHGESNFKPAISKFVIFANETEQMTVETDWLKWLATADFALRCRATKRTF